MQPRSPDFIGIGAQKAGTCWLRNNLGRHPGVWIPPLHELHYFDRSLPDSHFPSPLALERAANDSWRSKALSEVQQQMARGELAQAAFSALNHCVNHDDDWYRMLFAFAPPSSVVGEITPRYAICGEAEIAHMQAIAPKAKLIFLLRHPVDRFWSQCQMKHADGTLPAGDPPAMRLFDTANGRPRGEYSKTILRYCRHFDPAQILLVFFDGIRNDPSRLLRDIQAFLELPEASFNPQELAKPVNAATSRTPMPRSLRERIQAAYRSELQLLADVFGGPALSWLADSPVPAATPCTLPLAQAQVAELKARHRTPLGVRPRRTDRLFCLSMQRSGTTTVGDWLEAHGLVRAGYPTSARLGWTMLWMQGQHDAIFSSPEFQEADLYEDDPWWCGDFYKLLAERFANARFILLTRDADAWFASLCHHSGGYNPGRSDLHARLYQRQDALQALVKQNPTLDPSQPGLLSVVENEAHYKSIYTQHTAAVQEYFAATPGRLFTGPLGQPQTLIDLCAFAGVTHHPSIPIPRSNARTPEMAQRLAQYRQAGSRS